MSVRKHDDKVFQEDSPWIYLQDSRPWDKARAQELYGGDENATEKLHSSCQRILDRSAVDMEELITVPSLLPFLMSRDMLNKGEVEELQNTSLYPTASARCIKLAGCIPNKAKNALERFYLSLMDSCGWAGLGQHYHLANNIRQRVLNELGFNANDVVSQETDVSEIVRRMPRRNLPCELANCIAKSLGVQLRSHEEPPTEFSSLCYMWLRRGGDQPLDKLVEALLCTPRAGHLVTGLVPICHSNPPDLSLYMRETIGEDWDQLAHFIGLSEPLIESIKIYGKQSLRRQQELFLRVWRVPDCGERINEILAKCMRLVRGNGCSGEGPPFLKEVKTDPESHGDYYSLSMEQSQEVDVNDQMLSEFIKVKTETSENGSLAAHNLVTGDCHPCHEESAHVTYASPIASIHSVEEPENEFGHGPATDFSATEANFAVCDEEDDEYNDEAPSPAPQSMQSVQSSGQDLVDCCLKGDWSCVQALVESAQNEHGTCIELNGRDETGQTPLLICCKNEKINLVKLLIRSGADIKATDNTGRLCLHLDKVIKNLPLLQLLVDEFASQNISVEQYATNWYSPLLMACLAGERCKDAVELLLSAGANPNGHNRAAFRPLTIACVAGDIEIFHLLVSHAANIDVKDKSGATPLLYACLRYHHEIADYLITRGANCNLSDKTGTTPLFACVETGAYDLAKKLLQLGSPVNIIRTVRRNFASGSIEETPLANACGQGNLEMAMLLINNRADINRVCAGIIPPVGFAIISQQFHMVKYLIGLDRFDTSTLGLARPLIIGVKCENWLAVHLIIKKFYGTLNNAIQKVLDEGYNQLYEQLLVFMQKTNEKNLNVQLSHEIDNLQQRNSPSSSEVEGHYSVERNLQRFAQICISALKANTDLNEVATAATVEDQHYISDFFHECHNDTLNPIELKNSLLSGSPSPLKFALERELLKKTAFLEHAEMFYPGQLHNFCQQLVLTFHQMNTGADLPFNVDECLDHLFNALFVPRVKGHQPPRQPTAACRPNPLPAATSATTDHVQSSDFDPYQASMGGQPFAKESPSASRVRKEDRQGRHNRGAAVDRGDQITSTSDLTLPTQETQHQAHSQLSSFASTSSPNTTAPPSKAPSDSLPQPKLQYSTSPSSSQSPALSSVESNSISSFSSTEMNPSSSFPCSQTHSTTGVSSTPLSSPNQTLSPTSQPHSAISPSSQFLSSTTQSSSETHSIVQSTISTLNSNTIVSPSHSSQISSTTITPLSSHTHRSSPSQSYFSAPSQMYSTAPAQPPLQIPSPLSLSLTHTTTTTTTTITTPQVQSTFISSDETLAVSQTLSHPVPIPTRRSLSYGDSTLHPQAKPSRTSSSRAHPEQHIAARLDSDESGYQSVCLVSTPTSMLTSQHSQSPGTPYMAHVHPLRSASSRTISLDESKVLEQLKSTNIKNTNCEELFRKISPLLADRWRLLGEVLLEGDKCMIDSIQALHKGNEFVELLIYWVNHYKTPTPTWCDLEEAIVQLNAPEHHQQVCAEINKFLIDHCVWHTTLEVITRGGPDHELVKQIMQCAVGEGALVFNNTELAMDQFIRQDRRSCVINCGSYWERLELIMRKDYAFLPVNTSN